MYLGIDGGGTKTIGVIADETGKVEACYTVGSTNLNGVGIDQVREELTTLIRSLLEQVGGAKLNGCFAGIAGLGHPSGRAKVGAILRELLPDIPVEADIDPVNALYSGSKDGTGVVFIAGTGSICFSMTSNGGREKVGGWGYLLGDEGSGFDFGRRALQAVMKGYDGRLQPSPAFTAAILAHFQCSSPPDLIPVVYEFGKEKENISSVAPIVFAAYESGDATAKRIIEDAANEMLLMIRTALDRRIQLEAGESKVVLVGGVFQKQPVLVNLLSGRLAQEGYAVSWIVPHVPPVAGAVAKAIRNGARRLPFDFDERFIESFPKKD